MKVTLIILGIIVVFIEMLLVTALTSQRRLQGSSYIEEDKESK